jgi:hypothetical protein
VDQGQIIAELTYALKVPPTVFDAITRKLSARVSAEGAPGVLAYRFFVNADDGTARLSVVYADAAAWIAHHEIAMYWPEIAALRAAAALTEIVLMGPVTDAIRDWLAGSGITAQVVTGFAPAGGFVR